MYCIIDVRAQSQEVLTIFRFFQITAVKMCSVT